MPVRVLDRHGSGRADDIARGIQFAVDPRRRRDQHELQLRLRQARAGRRRGAALRLSGGASSSVASVGNLGSEACVSPPATGPRRDRRRRHDRGRLPGRVLAGGQAVDVVAPGGGAPVAGLPLGLDAADLPGDLQRRQHAAASASPASYVGTSMAAAHVSGVAAMVLASGLIEPQPQKAALIGAQVTPRLKTHRPQPRAAAAQQGAGLIDAARATDPTARGPVSHARRRGWDSGRADDDHAAGSVMGDVVGHAAEQEAARAGHPLVADDDQVGLGLFGDVEDRVRGVPLDRVGLDLDSLLLRARPRRASRTRLTSSRGPISCCTSAGASCCSPARGARRPARRR